MGLQGERLGVEEHLMDADIKKSASDEKHFSGESTSVSGSEVKHLSGDTPSTSVSEDKHLSGDSYLSAEDNTRYVTARSGPTSPVSQAKPEHQEHACVVKGLLENGTDPRNTNLDYFHGEARFDQELSEGQFTKIKGLSECCRGDGKVELHRWSTAAHGENSWAHATGSQDRTVVVKRVLSSRVGANVGKERNERMVCRGHSGRHAEDCLNEIGVYCYLSRQADLPQFILKMLAVFQSGSDVWMVLEHANSGDLFAVVQKLKREGTSLSMSQLMTWMWQLLQALLYMHQHGIGHRDISMENVLLCDGLVRLMDFGQSVQTHTAEGAELRYFLGVGKPYYRPAECHVPAAKTVQVNVPRDARPGESTFAQTTTGDCLCDVLLPSNAVPGQPCIAEPWGYAVSPVDIFACGVCLFIMTTGMPPWRNANLSDPHFTWVHQCGISQLLKHWQKPLPADADDLLTAMVHSVPTSRPSAQQCLSHRWFEPMREAQLPVHSPAPAARPASASQRKLAAVGGSAQQGVSPLAGAVVGSRGVEVAAGLGEDAGFKCNSGLSALECLSAAGDPYTKPLAVRSVAVPISETLYSPTFGGALAGDFYNMSEDLYRSSSTHPIELTLERFAGDDVPPSLPTDESFELEPTAFYVSGKEAVKLGNHLINFLSMAAGAVVTKVNTKKWTIKAEVDGESGACTLKTRVYSAGDARYAIEFQRRGGETTALHHVFDQAMEHLATPLKTPKVSKGEGSTLAALDKRPVKTGIAEIVAPRSGQPFTTSLSLARPLPRGGVRNQRRSLPAVTSRANAAVPKPSTPMAPDGLPTRPSSEPAGSLAFGSGLNAVRCRSKAAVGRFGGNSRLPLAARLNSTS